MAVSYEQYQKKSGETLWRFKAQYSSPKTSKRIATTRSGFSTKKEAKIAYEQLSAEVNNGDASILKDKQTTIKTFNQLFDIWWDSYAQSVTPSTQRIAKSIFDNHIIPFFGDVKLEQISSAMIQQWINTQSKKYASYDTYAAYLRTVLKYGYALDALQKNPFDKVIMPSKPHKAKPIEEKAWDIDTFKRWISALTDYKRINHKGFTYLWLLSFTGIRLGEGLALKWTDLDWQTGSLHIQRTVAVSYQTSNKRYYLDEPKTNAGNRILRLDNETLTVLSEWYKTQAGKFKFIFPADSLHDKPLVPATPKKWLVYVEQLAGIEHKKGGLHILRHTFATLAIENGFTPSQVQYQLGHSTSKITMDIYAHATKQAAANIGMSFANKLDL